MAAKPKIIIAPPLAVYLFARFIFFGEPERQVKTHLCIISLNGCCLVRLPPYLPIIAESNGKLDTVLTDTVNRRRLRSSFGAEEKKIPGLWSREAGREVRREGRTLSSPLKGNKQGGGAVGGRGWGAATLMQMGRAGGKSFLLRPI